MTDEQMIELLWNRNSDAITEIDAMYGMKLVRLANRIVQNSEDAEEVVNDTYMKTWETIPTNRPKYFYAYIAAICRNLSLNLLNWNQAAKRKAEIVAITEEMEQCIPDSKSDASVKDRDITQALNKFWETLSKETRIIFLRRYWYADSVVSIARRYNMTESKVKMQLLRTRSKLKDYLEKEGIHI